MDHNQILTELKKIFSNVFNRRDLEITENTKSGEFESWDSLAEVRLTLAIEQKFNIKFDIEEIMQINNIGDMVKLIQNRIEDR